MTTIGFALEYSLGHTTHADNLKRYLSGEAVAPAGGVITTDRIRPHYVDLPYDGTPVGKWGRMPGVRSNWTVRASLGAYLGMRRLVTQMDAALFHTQVTALFATGIMRRVPSVVSLDATPLQFDALGAQYGHARSHGKVEALKHRLQCQVFARAGHLIAWSEWAKASLVADYGVPAEKVTVIPPGIPLSLFPAPTVKRGDGRVLRLLFVGADFARKGGDTLLKAVRNHLPPGVAIHVDVVTRHAPEMPTPRNVTFHTNLTPNSDGLRRLFAEADAFVFPTRGDCLPLAVLEALASGLPVITTNVAALPEAVGHGEAGLVVEPDDALGLARAIATLAGSPDLCARLAHRAREIAEERFDARRNYARLVEVVVNTSGRS